MVGGWQSGAESSESVMAVVYPLGNKVKGLGKRSTVLSPVGKLSTDCPVCRAEMATGWEALARQGQRLNVTCEHYAHILKQHTKRALIRTMNNQK